MGYNTDWLQRGGGDAEGERKREGDREGDIERQRGEISKVNVQVF